MIVLGGIWLVFGNEKEQSVVAEKRISFISPMANSGYWGNVAGGIWDMGAASEMDVKCVGFSELNQEKQIYALENAVMSDVDGIITVAYENLLEFRKIVEEAQEAGIPVIFIDSDVKDAGRLCYIGSDNFRAGQLAGEKLATECGGRGKVAIITSFSDNANQKERISGFKDALKNFPDMEIVSVMEGQSNTGLIREMVAKVLEDMPQINAIFCTEGYGSGAVCEMSEKNREQFKKIKIVVFDYNEKIKHAIASSSIVGTIRQNPYDMGSKAVRVLQTYFAGNQEKIRDQYTDIELVTAENEMKSEYGEREDIVWHIY